MVDIPFPTPEEFSSRLKYYEEKFRHRYTQQDDDYRETVTLNRMANLSVPRIKPWPPPRTRMNSHDERDSNFRDRRGSRYSRSRKRHDFSMRSHGRHSPDYTLPQMDNPIYIPPPKTPTGSPTQSEDEDIIPFPTSVLDSMQTGNLVEAETTREHRNSSDIERSVASPLAAELEPPPQSAVKGGLKVEEESFDVSAPAFPIEKDTGELAPSHNDVTAILTTAHSTSKVAISASSAERFRKQKLHDERLKQRTSIERDRRPPPLPSHRVSRKKQSIKPTSATSAILSESIGQKPSAKRRKIHSDYDGGMQKSDEEEIDVENVDDHQTFDRNSSLTVSIPLPKVHKLKTEPILLQETTRSKSHKKSKKHKKEKRHKKEKERERQQQANPMVTTDISDGGLKLKIKNIKSYTENF